MVAVRQKAPDQLKYKRGGAGRGLVIQEPVNRTVPAFPIRPGHPTARAVWRHFWKSQVSWAVDPDADYAQLHRWAEMLSERAELAAMVKREGWQLVDTMYRPDESEVETRRAHPMLVHIKHLDREIGRFAEQFGLTPTARFRLALTFAEAGSASLKLNRDQDRADRRTSAIVDYDAPGTD